MAPLAVDICHKWCITQSIARCHIMTYSA